MNTLKLNSRNKRAGKKPVVATNGVPIRLDLGCGPNKKKTDAQGNQQAWLGVDSINFPGVDVVTDLRKPWPWDNDSVDEVHSSHFVEHLWNTDERPERVHFVNELWRVLKPGAKATIICPHWASCRAYGDFTHGYPPVAEFWFYYLSKAWRETQAPHNDKKWNPVGYTCNFEVTWGYSLHNEIMSRNQEYQAHALQFWKEAAQDCIATFTAVK